MADRMDKLPRRFEAFMEAHPDIGAAYGSLGDAVAEAGPLNSKVRALIKIGISVGAGQAGGTRSQVRKALIAGATHEEIRHAVLLATTTIGFPNMMAGLSWVDDVLEAKNDE